MIFKSEFSFEVRVNCKPEKSRGSLGLKVIAGLCVYLILKGLLKKNLKIKLRIRW